MEAIAKDPPYEDSNGLSRHAKLAIELGEPAIPALEKRLVTTQDPDEHLRIATTIAYLGGKQAVAILQRDAAQSPSVPTKAAFALAVPSAPSAEATAILISYFEGPQIGSTWFPIEQSAFSLGFMREKSAIPSLQKAATKQEGYRHSTRGNRERVDVPNRSSTESVGNTNSRRTPFRQARSMITSGSAANISTFSIRSTCCGLFPGEPS